MDWLERLNQTLARAALGGGTVELLHWNYAAHLLDNRPHRHTFFEVCLVGAYGQGNFVVQDRPSLIGPGDLFVARPGVLHQIVNTGTPDMELTWVSFGWTPGSGTGSEAALMRAFSQSKTIVAPDGGGQIAAIWRALHSVAGSGGSEAQLQALITALVLGIAQAASEDRSTPMRASDTPENDRAARMAVQFIHDNLAQPLSVPEIAAQISVSPRHLSRIFTRLTGHAPAQYVTQARMDRARALLLHSNLPIKEIAASVGYPDVHHFTRAFRAAFALPPGLVRKHPERAPVSNLQKPGAFV